MNWQEALEEIQSVEFDVNLNVVSGTNAFFRAVSQDPAVMEAYREMQQSGEVREEVIGRLYDLVKQETDPRFENPNDTSLAVLLWLTNFAAHEYAELTAAWVDLAPRCWYAKKLAQRILNPPPSATADSKFGKPPDGPMATGVTSGEIRFRLGLTLGETFQPCASNLRVAPYGPASTLEPPDQFAATFQEGTP